jgi:hypothetical protein
MWILRGPVDEGQEETGMWRGLRLLLFQEEVLDLGASLELPEVYKALWLTY